MNRSLPQRPFVSPHSTAKAQAVAAAMPVVMMRQLMLGSAFMLAAVFIVSQANAQDLPPLPSLPPLPGMEGVSAPAAPAAIAPAPTPMVQEMPALPEVEAPKTTTAAAPALDNAKVGKNMAPQVQSMPMMPELPGVMTREDIAFATKGLPNATAVSTLPPAGDIGPSEIDSWLNAGKKSDNVAALPAPRLPSDQPKEVVVAAPALDIPDTATASEDETADAPKKASKSAKKASAKKSVTASKKAEKAPFYSFQYKTQFLPDAIYRPRYDSDNKHLPVARYEQDYDRYVFQAAARNDGAGLRALLNTPGRSVEAIDPSGQTPLTVAVRYGAVQAAQVLLSYGANADHRDNAGVSVLHYAVLARNAALVQALLAARANPVARDPWGQTPLDIAAYVKDGASLRLLQNALQPQQATLGQPRS